MRIVSGFSVVILFLFASWSSACEQIENEIVAPYVQIAAGPYTGSGVTIKYNDEMLVLSARHVTDGSPDKIVTLIKIDDDEDVRIDRKGDIVYESDVFDLALIKPRKTEGLVSANYLGNVKIHRGMEAWYIGSPKCQHAFLEKTIVSRPSYILQNYVGSEVKHMIVNGNGWYGNSGGPAFVKHNDKFVLVGILTRLVWVDPKSPLACERQDSINEVLSDYKLKSQKID